jgi:hypothetical protein
MPADGMCTWLGLFPWRTLIGWCWLGVLKLHLFKEFDHNMLKYL